MLLYLRQETLVLAVRQEDRAPALLLFPSSP
jgi:hypothetical protein